MPNPTVISVSLYPYVQGRGVARRVWAPPPPKSFEPQREHDSKFLGGVPRPSWLRPWCRGVDWREGGLMGCRKI